MKTKFKIILILLILITVRLEAQVGTLTGWGESTCAQFSFNICPGQFVAPTGYTNTTSWACQNGNTQKISFALPCPVGFEVERNTWFFQSNVSGQITGSTIGQNAQPITQTFPPYTQIGPSYVGGSGVQFTPTGPVFDRNTFSISINPVTLSGNSYTYCPTNGPISISAITPFNGGPWSFNWNPGGLTGNPVNVNPAVNTVYTATATTIPGGCTSTTTVAVTVSNCATPCCIGNICGTSSTNPQYNPLTSSWEVPLNNKNYVFSGQAPLGNTNYRVGIGTNCFPNNKLEIDNGSINQGRSGLRLTRLPNNSPLSPSNGNVLSVDANGDVILVPDQTSPGGSGVTACGIAQTNYLTKFFPNTSQICNSMIWDNGTFAGVSTTAPQYKFQFAHCLKKQHIKI